MKEPNKIPLTDNPKSKTVKKIPLKSIETFTHLASNEPHENIDENNSKSVSELESDKTY